MKLTTLLLVLATLIAMSLIMCGIIQAVHPLPNLGQWSDAALILMGLALLGMLYMPEFEHHDAVHY